MTHFQKNSENNILGKYDKIYVKFEPIVKDTLELYSNEILFRVNNSDNSHIQVLESLRENNQSFSLFVRIINRGFQEVSETGNNLNINLEVSDICNTNFVGYLESMIEIYNIDTSSINFEIVEYKPITDSNYKVFLDNLRIINNLGFKISIDDLYSGYSNKNRIDFLLLNGIKISTVKIDGRFIKNMYECYLNSFSLSDSTTIDGEYIKRFTVRDFNNFNNYIKNLQSKGIKVVAEFIENKEMFDFAKSLGCDYFQGYYIQNMNANLTEI